MSGIPAADTALIQRLQTHLRNGTSDGAPDSLRLPADYYLDPQQWQREMDLIFQRVPLLAGFSVELPQPGNYKALQMLDKPVLLMRGADGQMRAFLNICLHRGAPLKAGSGSCGQLVCPYHAWRYNDRGELLRVQDENKFGPVDKSLHNLQELPCAEGAGLIFVSLSQQGQFDLREYLGGMLDELQALGLEHWHLWERREVKCGNWKLAHDGYLDGYHVASLHPQTVGPLVHNNVLLYDHWGPHQRMSFARKTLRPDSEPTSLAEDTSIIRTVFPNVSMSLTPGWGGMISLLWPGPTVAQSRTEQVFMYANDPDDATTADAIRNEIAVYHNAVRDEDYPVVDGVQRSLQSGAVDEVLFGRNELGSQRWHAWVKHCCEQNTASDAPEIPAQAVGGG